MKLYMIGLGKMGYSLAENAIEHGHEVVGYDTNPATMNKAVKDGIKTIDSIDSLKQVSSRKAVWVMLPAGKITDSVLKELENVLTPNDIAIDGGNSEYTSSVQRAKEFKENGIYFLDIGTSGGTYGARHGASFMVGGEPEAYKFVEPLLKDMAAENGLLYTGKSGSGHYLKVIHNAILHTELQVLGEGFNLLHASEFDYNLKDVAFNWSKSAVIRGWLMDLMYDAFSKNINLDDVDTVIHSSSAAADAIRAGLQYNIPVPTIEMGLLMRQYTQENDTFPARVINSLRKEVGGYKPQA
ncbi:decarboxylating 6-phosphogluconate dehydrogenase [Lactobacillus sp. ESL0791]|uniref:phosphogluconate dehydrogenase (NAD(+)-dependent, decarboxylating) n=1 Tax=Lactobacillus sp. ESL0791 TaxID=2983234 RepID=UPI0023F8E361|nr:decarboxylating 6-phosphogluconate dehydrogenase [Lactobacillus sp. ESL0791]MDF7639269.1 decarboxylating 6-phosphogluconate dehydrogenase [Lactobacillus sp. ESL0791]